MDETPISPAEPEVLTPRTGQIQIAPMPDEVRSGGLLAADLTAVMAFLKGSCRMSYSILQCFFKETAGLDLSRGILCKATQKVSQALEEGTRGQGAGAGANVSGQPWPPARNNSEMSLSSSINVS